jgi:tol-pal system protein YbgF
MYSLDYNKLKYFLFTFLLLFITKFGCSQENDYLDSVIQRINDLESELKNIQSSKPNNFNNKDNYTNSIASHEQRLIELEEEIRNLNGSLEELNFKMDNIFKLLKTTELSEMKQSSNEETLPSLNSNQTAIEPIEKETTIIEDPNIKNNPSMKVLGTVNESLNKKNKESILENNLPETTGGAPKQGEISDDKITSLLKNPSEIYSYAYNMLVRENFVEAEKSFKAFIGEHPDDPLASNAYYWLGETYYVQKKFQLAAISFARGFQNFPKGNKAIDQLFKLALTFMNLGKNEDACAAFSKLESEFPNAPKRISNRAKEYIKRAKC